MIRTEGLTHRYSEQTEALHGIMLDIDAGECFGLIGANGAGKTTTLRILATLLTPTGGTARIGGHDLVTEHQTVRRLIGYMPETFSLFPELTVEEFLDYAAAAYGFRGDEKRRRVEAVVALTDLGSKRGDGCDTLSRGMKQRVFLARALVHDPPVLLLDEPTSGLDPAARVEFRQIMKELTAAGKTTVVSSHNLPDLSEICTSIGILERGRLVVSGRIAEILASLKGPRDVDVEVVSDAQAVANALRGRAGVDEVRVDGPRAWIRYSGSREALPELLQALLKADVPVVAFGQRRTSLEEIFLKVAAFEVG